MKEIKKTIKEINRTLPALDVYSRIYIGQYEELFRINDWSFMFERNSHLEALCYELRKICIPQLSGQSFAASLGIWGPSTPVNAMRAYDIQQILRYQLAYYDNPAGGNTVNFDSPYIHGQWKLTDDDKLTIKNIVNQFKYPDYFPRGLKHLWECPLIISGFSKDGQNEATILRDEKQIDKYIEDAMKVYELLKNKQIYEAFMVLYPHMNDNVLLRDLCHDIEKEIKK